MPVLVTEIPSSANGGVSADGKTITLKLRDDITWSDGEPLTADDFVFTYNMIMSEQNVPLSRYPYEDYVTNVEAPDALSGLRSWEDTKQRIAQGWTRLPLALDAPGSECSFRKYFISHDVESGSWICYSKAR